MIEVLFSIIILGIGMTMLAAMFPVAIRQTRASLAETQAAAIGPAALRTLGQIIQTAASPPGFSGDPAQQQTAGATGKVCCFVSGFAYPSGWPPDSGKLWPQIQGNMILSSNPSYGWVGFYRRDNNLQTTNILGLSTVTAANFVYIYVMPVIAGSESAYTVADLGSLGAAPTASPFLPQMVSIAVTCGSGTTPSTITFSGINANNSPVAEYSYVLIADAGNANSSLNGKFLRVGANAGGNTWNLLPGYDLQDVGVSLSGAQAFIIGRQPDPSSPGAYRGPTQDIGAFTGTAGLAAGQTGIIVW